MKIQCNACEAAEAKVLCCADEAALCLECDDKVHTANKLAGKHQRVPLLSASSSPVPKCDICQEFSGYFFCLEDRALLCRNCDVAVHTANSCVTNHHRFLLTGVQAGLESMGSIPSVSNGQSISDKAVPKSSPKQIKSSAFVMPYSGGMNETFSSQLGKDENEGAVNTFFGASMSGEWPLDEFFRFTDFNQNYGFTDNGSFKVDSGKLGSSEGSFLSHSFDEEMEVEEFLGQVPESPSPPTASGLHWHRNTLYAPDIAAFVPDISSSQDPHYGYHSRLKGSKRRRLLASISTLD